MYHPLPAFSHSLGMGSQTGCKGQTLLCGSDRGDFLLFCSWTQSESSRKRRWDTPHVLCATSLQLCLCSPGGAGSSLGEHRALGALSVTAEESRWWVRWGRTDGLRRVFLHQAGEIISSLHLPHASCTNDCGKLLTFTFLMYSSFFSVHSMRHLFCCNTLPPYFVAPEYLPHDEPEWSPWTSMTIWFLLSRLCCPFMGLLYRCTSGGKRGRRWEISTDLAVLQQGYKGTSSALILHMFCVWVLTDSEKC